MFKKPSKENLIDMSTQEINTLIGDGFHLVGNVSGTSAIRIDGRITGNVDVKSGIILGEKGIIEGDLISDSAIIYGTITGNIQADKLNLKNSANIQGDIRAGSLEMENGARFNGRLNMLGKDFEKVDINLNSLKDTDKKIPEIKISEKKKTA